MNSAAEKSAAFVFVEKDFLRGLCGSFTISVVKSFNHRGRQANAEHTKKRRDHGGDIFSHAGFNWNGSFRSRCPEAAKIAFATAGAAGGKPGSPIPPGSSLLLTKCTSTGGASLIRIGSYPSKFVCSTAPFLIVISFFSAALSP